MLQFSNEGSASVHLLLDVDSLNDDILKALASVRKFFMKIEKEGANVDPTKGIKKSLETLSLPNPNSDKRVKLSFGNFAFVSLLTDAIKDAAKGVAGGAFHGAIASFKAFAESGAEFARVAEKTGLAVESLSSLSVVASRAQISAEALASAAAALGADASEAARAGIERLGLSFDALVEKNAEDRFVEVVDALRDVTDETTRAAIASDVFGENASELGKLLDGTTASARELVDEARDAGLVMSEESARQAAEFKKQIDRLKTSAIGLGTSLARVLAPVAGETVDELSKAARAAASFFAENKKAVNATASASAALAACAVPLLAANKLQEASAPLWNATATAIKSATAALTTTSTAAKGATAALATTAAAEDATTAAATRMGVALGAARVAALGIGAALAAGVIASNAWLSAATSAAELSTEMKEAAENAETLRRSDKGKFEFLETISNQGTLANETFDKGARFVEELQKRYGDLGITVDATTKSITAAGDAQERFSAEAQKDAKAALEKEIAEESDNYGKLQDEQNRKVAAYQSFGGRLASAPRNVAHWIMGDMVDSTADVWSAQVEETGKKILDSQKRLNELRKKLKEIEANEEEAVFGKNKSKDDVPDENLAVENAKRAEELDGKLAESAERRARSQRTASQNAIVDAKREEEEYVELLEARLALEKSKPDGARDAKRILELENELATSGDRLQESLARLADEYAQDDGDVSAYQKRVDAIEEESAAVRALLDERLALAKASEASRIQERDAAKEAAVEAARRDENAWKRSLETQLAEERAKPDGGRNDDKAQELQALIDSSDARLRERVAEIEAEYADDPKKAASERTVKELESQIKGLDASTEAKKQKAFEESTGWLESDEILAARREYNDAYAEAAKDGQIDLAEQTRLESFSERLKQTLQEAASAAFDKANKDYADALADLEEARLWGDENDIASAAEALQATGDALEDSRRDLENLTSAEDWDDYADAFAEELNDALDEYGDEFRGSSATFSAFEAADLANADVERQILEESRRQTRLQERLTRQRNYAVFA